MQWIFWYDWILMPVYFFLLVKIFFSFAKKRYNGKIYKYFRYGFLAKMTGALGFAFYHQYIYGGGDTFLFFDTGLKIADFATSDFHRFAALVFKPVESTVDYHFDSLDEIVFAEANFFVPRVTAILSFITFRSYLSICLLFSAISFGGIWYAYSSLLKIYPAFEKEFAMAFLFIPSVILWGSGLGKDSITLGCTCLVFGSLLRLFLIPKQSLFKNLILLSIGFFVVILVKPYIIYSFSLSFAIGILFQRIANMKNKGLKVFMAIMLVMGSLAATFVGYGYMISDPNFGLDLVSEKVIALNKNLGTQSGAGSAYDLGLDVSSVNSFTDIIPVFPKSIFVTLFRPFLWEIS
ncbi:hypothetical protein, partial [Ferruginibacter sp.]|uniref:hypothetical protein n=1 Tax=Ferruginibacter sp. TaxID=1940288 RepID=UPI0019B9E1D4